MLWYERGGLQGPPRSFSPIDQPKGIKQRCTRTVPLMGFASPMFRHLLHGLAAILLHPAIPMLAQESAYVPGDIMVMLRAGETPERVVQDLRSMQGYATGLHVAQELSAPLRTWLLRFDTALVAQPAMLRHVQAHPAVQLAQHNHLVTFRNLPDDPLYAQQWHHERIGSEQAWAVSTGGVTATGDTIVVCIIERADLPHPDLYANAWVNHAEIPGNGLDDDGNGYVDDHLGWNTPAGNDAVFGSNHGTQVAGMAGAVGNNTLGVVGANWGVKLMVVNHGGTQEAQVVAAYTYPLVMRRLYNESNGQSGAFVVATNASWGINGGQPANSPIWCAMYDSLGTAGILNCGATSNSNVDVDVVGDLPSACPSDYLVSVTATNVNDERTFSAYGATTIDVGAPGAAVFTTTLGGGYGTANGTSFASPLTAGVIGLLYSAPCPALMELVQADPAAGAIHVRDLLFAGVEQVGNLPGQTVTGGRIHAGNSMALIMDACGPCPAPYGLVAENTLIGEATLSWNNVAGSAFDLRYRPAGTSDWTELDGLTTTTVAITGLLPCTLYEFQVRNTCGEGENSGYSNLRTWTSEGCCNAPPALSIDVLEPTSAAISWGTVLAASSYELRWRIPGGTWTVLPVPAGTGLLLKGLAECQAHEVQLRSICAGAASDWSTAGSFNTPGCGDCIDGTFCAATGANALSEWIERVQVGQIDHTSGNDGGYGDHTAFSTPLPIGVPQPITLTPGFAFFAYNEYFRVWIDLDGDGQFSEPQELVFDAGSASNAAVSGALLVPAGTSPGGTRMRVVMRYLNPTADGCPGTYDFGETEDYCVELVEGEVGVAEHGSAQGVLAYPSPADQVLHVRVNGAGAMRPLVLLAYDQAGRQVAQGTLHQGQGRLDTSALANGAYVCRVEDSDGRPIATGRFAVLHGR